MISRLLVVTSCLFAMNSFASVSIEEKVQRINALEKLNDSSSGALTIDAFKRELVYDSQNLTTSQKSKSESQLLIDKIKKQVFIAYDEASTKFDQPEEAYSAVKEKIQKDLEFSEPSMKDELERIALAYLDAAFKRETSLTLRSEKLEKILEPRIKERENYLNEKIDLNDTNVSAGVQDPARTIPTTSKDTFKTRYDTEEELLESLTSDRESARWVFTSNITAKSSKITKKEAEIALQIRMEFMGVGIEAGPFVTFKREYFSFVSVMAEGLYPVVTEDDKTFDLHKKDRLGEIVLENGKPKRRFASFFCEVGLEWELETGASSKVRALVGGKLMALSKDYKLVNLQSRRLLVPDSVEGRLVNLDYLANLCQGKFLDTKFMGQMTVKDSLNKFFINVTKKLVYTNPKTECATDFHCVKWFKTKLGGLIQAKNTPRCMQDKNEQYFTCELRGLEGQNCSVYKNGKLVSNGMFEFQCDAGLKCVQTSEAGWFTNARIYSYAKGECRPVDPATYSKPVYGEKKDYIEAYLVNPKK